MCEIWSRHLLKCFARVVCDDYEHKYFITVYLIVLIIDFITDNLFIESKANEKKYFD